MFRQCLKRKKLEKLTQLARTWTIVLEIAVAGHRDDLFNLKARKGALVGVPQFEQGHRCSYRSKP
jgi:hypothetical protein